jgi:flagellar basal-body rod protein FlgB
MKICNVFDNTIKTLQKSLDVRARKHEVIISNIANVDTPEYKAFDLIVEDELSRAESNEFKNNLIRTHPSHLPARIQKGTDVTVSKIQLSKEVSLRGDGNTVNMEKEMAELSENNIMYRTSADILSRKLQGLLKAIQVGRRT